MTRRGRCSYLCRWSSPPAAGGAGRAARQVEPDWGRRTRRARLGRSTRTGGPPSRRRTAHVARTVCGSCPVRRSLPRPRPGYGEWGGLWGGSMELSGSGYGWRWPKGTHVAAVLDPHTRTAAA